MKSDEYEVMFRVEDRHWWYRGLRRHLTHHLNRFLPSWQSEKILDAGCGTGGNLQHLGACPSHSGVDLSATAIEFCQQRGLPNVIEADVMKLPFENESFAAVMATSVLYHQWIPSVGTALQEFNRVLPPGGWLFIDVPAYESLRSAHDDAVLTARRFNAKMIRDELTSHGFEIRRLTYWTSLLFPLAWIARRLRLLRSGRDFDQGRLPNGLINGTLNGLMFLEFQLARLISLPFGVSLAVVAQKTA